MSSLLGRIRCRYGRHDERPMRGVPYVSYETRTYVQSESFYCERCRLTVRFGGQVPADQTFVRQMIEGARAYDAQRLAVLVAVAERDPRAVRDA